MSILIKSMKMPSSCWECKLEQFIDCDVFQGVTSASEYRDKRYANCPIIELPQHGRLIDADELMPDAMYRGTYDTVSAWDIANAPTIIEADDEQLDTSCGATDCEYNAGGLCTRNAGCGIRDWLEAKGV